MQNPIEKLKKNPYEEINGFFEKTLPKTGGKISRYVSLMNPSLLIPKIVYKGREIRTTISVIILGPSGSGKTSFLDLAKSFLFKYWEFQHTTPAKLAKELSEVSEMTMIVNDMSRIMKDEKAIKVMEGVIEEGRFIHQTMTSDYSSDVNSCLLGVSVPSDISSHISSGLLFRVVPIMVKHDLDEQKNVGRDISENIGIYTEEGEITINHIKEYYQKLRKIQQDKDVDNPRIDGFLIKDEHKDKVYKEWSRLLEKLEVDETTLWFRELLDGFRFLNSLTFLNYFERIKEEQPDGRIFLIPNENDLKIAIKLMQQEILTKYSITTLHELRKKLVKMKKIEG